MTRSEKRELPSSVPDEESAMPMLFWFPMIVMAGVYEAMSDDMAQLHRAFVRINNRDA